MVVVAFEAFYGRRGCGPSRASVLVPLAMVVSFVTGAATVAWAAGGPDRGLLTLGTVSGFVVALRCCMAWRERRWWASYSAAQSAAGGEGQR